MTLRRHTTLEALPDIRKRFQQGHVEATVQRVQGLAARESDPETLRQLLAITCEALLAAPQSMARNGRPAAKKLVVTKDGAIDLDATPPMTERELLRAARDLSQDHSIFHAVEDLRPRFNVTGAICEVARIRRENEHDVRKAYYRVKNALSLKV